jgi:hypothetical protein
MVRTAGIILLDRFSGCHAARPSPDNRVCYLETWSVNVPTESLHSTPDLASPYQGKRMMEGLLGKTTLVPLCMALDPDGP